MELRIKENERNAIDEEQIIANMKTESDYRAQFVKRVNEEITKEKKNTSSKDAVVKAEAEAVVKFLTTRLNEEKQNAARALADYTERSAHRAMIVKREKDSMDLEKEQFKINKAWTKYQTEENALRTLEQSLEEFKASDLYKPGEDNK